MTPKIVFLDASTVDYGDLDLSPIARLGDFHAHSMTGPGHTAARLADAAVAVTNKVVLDRGVLAHCPALKFIAVAATGYNNIDMAAARERGVAVANVAGYSTPSVAQFTILFILALASRLVEYNAACRDGRWSASPIFTMGNWPTMELAGKVLGILGLGAIGSEVARLARAFGMEVIALKRAGATYGGDIPRRDLLELAGMSDFVSVHMPLTGESRHIVDGRFLGAMKRGAFLINMARGPLVDPAALTDALASGALAGAAIDVMEKEPPAADDPLLRAPNLIITPHIAWATHESRARLVSEIGLNIAAFLAGEKRNIVA